MYKLYFSVAKKAMYSKTHSFMRNRKCLFYESVKQTLHRTSTINIPVTGSLLFISVTWPSIMALTWNKALVNLLMREPWTPNLRAKRILIRVRIRPSWPHFLLTQVKLSACTNKAHQHMASQWHHTDFDATCWHRIDVGTTSFWCHVSACTRFMTIHVMPKRKTYAALEFESQRVILSAFS